MPRRSSRKRSDPLQLIGIGLLILAGIGWLGELSGVDLFPLVTLIVLVAALGKVVRLIWPVLSPVLGWTVDGLWGEVATRIGRPRVPAYTEGELWAMTPEVFEDTVAVLLEDLGFSRVEPVGGSGDRGVDIECYDRDGGLVLVQCKRLRPGARIGSPLIQTFMGAVYHRQAKCGIFASTCGYSPEALILAKEARIIPIDGRGIVRLMHLARDQRTIGSPLREVERRRARL